MDGITELAKLLKERENGAIYSPVCGVSHSVSIEDMKNSVKVITEATMYIPFRPF